MAHVVLLCLGLPPLLPWPDFGPQWTDWAGTASAQEAADRVGPRTLFLRGPVPEGTGSEQSAVSLLLEALCPMADPCHGGGCVLPSGTDGQP